MRERPKTKSLKCAKNVQNEGTEVWSLFLKFTKTRPFLEDKILKKILKTVNLRHDF